MGDLVQQPDGAVKGGELGGKVGESQLAALRLLRLGVYRLKGFLRRRKGPFCFLETGDDPVKALFAVQRLPLQKGEGLYPAKPQHLLLFLLVLGALPLQLREGRLGLCKRLELLVDTFRLLQVDGGKLLPQRIKLCFLHARFPLAGGDIFPQLFGQEGKVDGIGVQQRADFLILGSDGAQNPFPRGGKLPAPAFQRLGLFAQQFGKMGVLLGGEDAAENLLPRFGVGVEKAAKLPLWEQDDFPKLVFREPQNFDDFLVYLVFAADDFPVGQGEGGGGGDDAGLPIPFEDSLLGGAADGIFLVLGEKAKLRPAGFT